MYYSWDIADESLRVQVGEECGRRYSDLPPDLQRVDDSLQGCGKCGDQKHNFTHCPYEVWTLKLFNCNFCGAALFWLETHGQRCRKKSASVWAVILRRRHTDTILPYIYSHRYFQSFSVSLNYLVTCAHQLIHILFSQSMVPSFPKNVRHCRFSLPYNDSQYIFVLVGWIPQLQGIRSEVPSISICCH